jgi:hypothetical protein
MQARGGEVPNVERGDLMAKALEPLVCVAIKLLPQLLVCLASQLVESTNAQ